MEKNLWEKNISSFRLSIKRALRTPKKKDSKREREKSTYTLYWYVFRPETPVSFKNDDDDKRRRRRRMDPVRATAGG